MTLLPLTIRKYMMNPALVTKITHPLLFAFLLAMNACATQNGNQNPVGEVFPSVTGQSLDKTEFRIPEDFSGRTVLLLVGYKQDAQFDIDRWLIGLDMTKTHIDVYEIPTIRGMLPRMLRSKIDNGMRAGIPKELWKGIITIYDDSDIIQSLTGIENPNNARCILLDMQGTIIFFHDRGFSVDALNTLRSVIMEKP